MSNLYNQLAEDTAKFSTITDYVRFATSLFNEKELYFGHGTDNAYDESVNLVLSSLKLPNDIPVHTWTSHLTSNERKVLLERISSRVEDSIPVAYLVNETWFAGFSFYVDKRVIIPRSPIAELIEEEFSPWIEAESINTVLDMCTGSGCIAIATALTLEDVEVDAVDLSEDAIAVANLNVENYSLEDRVNVIKSDLFSELTGKKYDLIICNPPYVAGEEYDELPKEYFHEPKNALYADNEGIAIIKKFLSEVGEHLTPNGLLILEAGSAQDVLHDFYADAPFTWVQFDRGGDGVLIMNAAEVESFTSKFKEAVNKE